MTGLVVAGLTLVMLLAVAGHLMSRMPGRSFAGPLPELSPADKRMAERLRTHVQVLAGRIGERNVWHYENLQLAAAYIEAEFTRAGLQPQAMAYQAVGKQVHNIEATIGGRDASGGTIVVGAHYDSLIHTTGANDNASGVAALLELAHLLGTGKHQRTVRLVAFVNEEPPFFKTSSMGSRVYAQQLRDRQEYVAGMISLETLGYYTTEPLTQKFPLPLLRWFYPHQGDFVAMVGNLPSRRMLTRALKTFRQHAQFPSAGLVAPGWLPGVDWSDHWSFWQSDCPAIMVTDTAPFRYPYYHTARDTPEQLNYEALARVVAGLQPVIADLANR